MGKGFPPYFAKNIKYKIHSLTNKFIYSIKYKLYAKVAKKKSIKELFML